MRYVLKHQTVYILQVWTKPTHVEKGKPELTNRTTRSSVNKINAPSTAEKAKVNLRVSPSFFFYQRSKQMFLKR